MDWYGILDAISIIYANLNNIRALASVPCFKIPGTNLDMARQYQNSGVI
jgi:hypothetical protein